MQSTPTKINKHSRSITEARTRSSCWVHNRSLQDVNMAPDSLLDLLRVRSRHCSLMRPSCSPASSPSTMASDALHTHSRTVLAVCSPRRLQRTVLFAPRDATRLAPCAAPALLADAAVLLARLVAVHNGLRRPAHALAPRPCDETEPEQPLRAPQSRVEHSTS